MTTQGAEANNMPVTTRFGSRLCQGSICCYLVQTHPIRGQRRAVRSRWEGEHGTDGAQNLEKIQVMRSCRRVSETSHVLSSSPVTRDKIEVEQYAVNTSAGNYTAVAPLEPLLLWRLDRNTPLRHHVAVVKVGTAANANTLAHHL